MSYLDWHVGMKVVCVSAGWSKRVSKEFPGVRFPVEGGVYTLREIFAEERLDVGGRVFVRLAEIINAPHETEIGPYEAAFAVGHFRKVEPRKTDISALEALLHTTRVPSSCDRAAFSEHADASE